MTVGSLFTGIGGLDLGLERVGFTVKWQVEIDPFCNKVLEKHWPGVKRYGDIKGIRWEEAERVDIVCGGFPCPPVSCAGKRKGNEDERWLWPEFERCIRSIRPEWIIIENVRGLLSSNSGREFAEVLRSLSSVGYDAQWGIVSASSVGAPHRRERVFIVGHSQHSGCRTFGKDDQLRGSDTYRGTGEQLANPRCIGIDADQQILIERGEGKAIVSETDSNMANTAGESQREQGNPTIRPRNPDIGGNGNIMENPHRAGHKARDDRTVYDEGRPMQAMLSASSDEIPDWPPGPEERDAWNEILRRHPELAPAVDDTRCINHQLNKQMLRKKARGLNTSVCSSENCHPSSQTKPALRRVAHGVFNRLHRLKALGNAVVPKVAEVVGRLILEANIHG